MANEFTVFYRVHSAALVPHQTAVTIEGEEHQATVKALVVELVPEDVNSPHGSVKLVRVAGAKTLAELQGSVKPGTRISGAFSVVQEK